MSDWDLTREENITRLSAMRGTLALEGNALGPAASKPKPKPRARRARRDEDSWSDNDNHPKQRGEDIEEVEQQHEDAQEEEEEVEEKGTEEEEDEEVDQLDPSSQPEPMLQPEEDPVPLEDDVPGETDTQPAPSSPRATTPTPVVAGTATQALVPTDEEVAVAQPPTIPPTPTTLMSSPQPSAPTRAAPQAHLPSPLSSPTRQSVTPTPADMGRDTATLNASPQAEPPLINDLTGVPLWMLEHYFKLISVTIPPSVAVAWNSVVASWIAVERAHKFTHLVRPLVSLSKCLKLINCDLNRASHCLLSRVLRKSGRGSNTPARAISSPRTRHSTRRCGGSGGMA